jgi:hypothetical protein
MSKGGSQPKMKTAPDQIEEALKALEENIAELRELMTYWNSTSVNVSGAKKYKGVSRRIVLQAQQVDELVKSNVYS